MELMQAHTQWLRRPDDERFTSLDALYDHALDQQEHSTARVVSSRSFTWEPANDTTGLVARGPSGAEYSPTHWAFSQACGRVNAPADFLRDMPAPMTADILNYRFQFKRDIEDTGVLLYQNGGAPELRAVTGPGYGRVWNAEIARTLRTMFGDGTYKSGSRFHIPGEYNKHDATVTKQSTTLYAGDRDMWVFLCDGKNDVEIPNRRDGKTGRMQRGFFCWNSEVGAKPIGLATFVYDFMCGNHIIWGVNGFEEIRIRHTASAPDKWLQEIVPALETYANSDTASIKQAIVDAQQKRLGDKVADFLSNRFGPRMVAKLQATHQAEEQRPIETVFDAVTAATAVARQMPWIGPRVDLEREAGKLLVAA